MAIPSGSGTEVLKRVVKTGLNNAWFELLPAATNHIRTILSITYNEMQNLDSPIKIYINQGSAPVAVLDNFTVAKLSTFVWNDKFVLDASDTLDIYNTTTDSDWIVSYIDQDWS